MTTITEAEEGFIELNWIFPFVRYLNVFEDYRTNGSVRNWGA